MTNWTAFDLVRDNAVAYFFGDYLIFSFVMSVLFLIILVGVGIDFRYAIVFTLPVLAGFASIGYFGSFGWIVNVALIIIGLIYGFVLIRLYGG